jgi:hypothetical protein
MNIRMLPGTSRTEILARIISFVFLVTIWYYLVG